MAPGADDEDRTIEVAPWCDHHAGGAEPACRRPGTATGQSDPDGRVRYRCSAGHDFLWPHVDRDAKPTRR